VATFGDLTAGGDDFPSSGDRALLAKFTCPTAGTLTQINVFFSSASTAGMSMKGLIYADDGAGNTPGTRLGVGNAVAVPAGASDTASTGLSVALSASTDYWIGYVADSFEARAQMDIGGGGSSRMEGTTYASPNATWTESGTAGNTLNAYGTYTESSSGSGILIPTTFRMQAILTR